MLKKTGKKSRRKMLKKIKTRMLKKSVKRMLKKAKTRLLRRGKNKSNKIKHLQKGCGSNLKGGGISFTPLTDIGNYTGDSISRTSDTFLGNTTENP